MGKIDHFKILLEKSNSVYFCGETILGSISIRVKERLKINAVKASFIGYCRVHWVEHVDQGRKRRAVHNSSSEEHLNHTLLFTKSNNENDDLYLENGDHLYKFKVLLPNNLPTSFEHTHGRIRYLINGTIDIPWAFDKYTQKTFTVVNPYDLNLNQTLKETYAISVTKFLCCFFCKSDPIIVTFEVTKTGFVSGEKIGFKVDFQNGSNREIKECKVSLLQCIKFASQKKIKQNTRCVSTTDMKKAIGKKSREAWSGCIMVPPISSTSKGLSKIIYVTYKLTCHFDLQGPSFSNDLTIPVTIGTVPLKLGNNEASNFPFTYEECAFGIIQMPIEKKSKAEILETDAENFRPFYPFYRNIN